MCILYIYIYTHIPAPSKGCQLNPKGSWIDTLKRNRLAPFGRSRYIYIIIYIIYILYIHNPDGIPNQRIQKATPRRWNGRFPSCCYVVSKPLEATLTAGNQKYHDECLGLELSKRTRGSGRFGWSSLPCLGERGFLPGGRGLPKLEAFEPTNLRVFCFCWVEMEKWIEIRHFQEGLGLCFNTSLGI